MNVEDHETDEWMMTAALHSGYRPENQQIPSVSIPLYLSSNYLTHGFSEGDPYMSKEVYLYSRVGNPNRAALEKSMFVLEGGKYAVCVSSGTAALAAVVGLLSAGDHVLAQNIIYGGSVKYLRNIAPRQNIGYDFVHGSSIDDYEVAIKENTKMVFIETPANPTLGVIDIAAMAKMTKSRGLLLVVDSTFATPCYQRPLSLGADIVLHSLAKYINGHSDLVMGAVVVNDDQLYDRLQFYQVNAGPVPSPFDCYLALRGLKTLPLRMRQHMKNGLAVAKFLESHPGIEKVLHPGLPSHPDHEVARKQMTGYSGMVSFYIRGGLKEILKFLKSLKLVQEATSLGGLESIVQVPAIMSHANLPAKERAKLGLTDNMVRMSVGLEAAEDINKDLDQAIKAALQQEED